VNHPARRQVAGARRDGLAEADRRGGVALSLNRRTARARDRARDTATVEKLRVRSVGDRIDGKRREIDVEDFDNRRQATSAGSSLPCSRSRPR
jgi:hypothetical protein